jgi:hypothetical protein
MPDLHERRDIEALIKAHGGVLERQRKHHVWRFPDGRTFSMPGTPSDFRAGKNKLAALRKFLGLERDTRKNPERRVKPGVIRKSDFEPSGVRLRDLKSQLAAIVKPSPTNRQKGR